MIPSAPDERTDPSPADATQFPREKSTGPDDGVTLVSTDPPSVRLAVSLPAVPGYELTHEIARGGMGAVYAARDLALTRDVAIKVLLPGGDADRFVTEARVTALLPHPDIPPVYQLGTLPTGEPFLAMKLIRGKTLAEFLKGDPTPPDPTRLVQVFEQICQAVGFAHSVGVIHRDLKPGNVMIGAFGEVQVMDWGLARVGRAADGRPPADEKSGPASPSPSVLLSPSSAAHTVAGLVMGTPSYMAPEQARGETVGARADVFALGGLLTTILTGRPPFEGNSGLDTVKRAAAADLAPALDRLARSAADPELIAVARQCLAPAAADRPADGGAVAALVVAYRAGVELRLRQTEAARVAAVTKADEQRKRRAVQLALAVAVGLLAAAGGGFAWWQDRQAEQAELTRARFEAEQERAGYAAALRDQAERDRLDRNGLAVAGLLGQCEDGLRADDAGRAAVPLEQAEKRLAEGGAEHLRDRLARCRLELDMLTELDRIDALRLTAVDGVVVARTVQVAAWTEVLRRAGIALGTTPPAAAAGRINDSPNRDRLLAALDIWAATEASADAYRPLLAILREADPDPYRNAIRGAIKGLNGGRLGDLLDQPAALAQPARFAGMIGMIPILSPARRDQILRTAHARQPQNFSLLTELAKLDKADKTAAVGWYRAALAVRPTNALIWNNLGVALLNTGDREGALAAYREAVRHDPKLTSGYLNMGIVHLNAGETAAAITAYREATRLDPRNTTGLNNLAAALRQTGDTEEAIAVWRRATAVAPANATLRHNLALALHARGEADAAIAELRTAIWNDPQAAQSYHPLGVMLSNKGDEDGAVAAFREGTRHPPQPAATYTYLGVLLLKRNDVAGAAAAFGDAVKLDPKSVQALGGLGAARMLSGDVDGAAAAWQEVLKIEPKNTEALLNLPHAMKLKADREARTAPPPRLKGR